MTWGPETPDKSPYTQCRIERTVDGRRFIQMLWVPSKFAKKGKILRVKGRDGKWTTGWLVTKVYSTTRSRPDPKRDVREHRRNTGDSLPRS